MPACVALLGSINVGGNRVAMADLTEAFANAGFADVRTVAASGNVVFECAAGGTDASGGAVEALVSARFGFDVFAAVFTRAEIVAADAANPFAADGDAKLVHCCFLDAAVSEAQASDVASAAGGNERVAAGNRMLFVDYRDGVARSKLTTALIRKQVGCRSTARNIRSLARIADAMDVR